MKTSSIAVETSRSISQSDSIVRQTNKRSFLSDTTMNNIHICNDKFLFRIFHFFLAFSLEDPFLSRGISFQKFSSSLIIVFNFRPPYFQD